MIMPSWKNNNEAGYTTVEVLMVMALLAILGMTMLTLIYAGSETYQRIDNNKNAEIDARNALSYLNIKTRQNDIAEGISVYPMPETGDNALVIQKAVGDEVYRTWIFWQEGKLWECMVLDGEPPSTRLSFKIVEIAGFEVELTDQLLHLKLTYEYAGMQKELSSKTYIRSQIGSTQV